MGELYRVDMETVAMLDDLEGHPTHYRRIAITVTMDSAPDDVVTCETYVLRNFRRQLLTTEPLLAEYRDTPERRFVEPGNVQEVFRAVQEHYAASELPQQ